MTWRRLAIGLLAAGCFAAPASAQIRLNDKGSATSEPLAPARPSAPSASADAPAGDLIDGRDIEQLAAVLRELGFQAKIGQSSNGQPRITSAAQGINFSITTYSCSADSKSCSIDFFTFWRMGGKSMSLERINDWNREWRFLKAYNDKEGDLNLVFNIELTGGISKTAFTRNFQRWTSMLARFDKFRQE
ncbi:YbjN domain-containing protein [Enterovirga rhinocerotis]|nr:YbjN domain-containing protein [Enterovirga rhinocerotis]